MVLFDNIKDIISLKQKLPEWDTRLVLGLIYSECNKLNHKVIEIETFNSNIKDDNIKNNTNNNIKDDPNNTSIGKPYKKFVSHKKQAMKEESLKPSMSVLADPRIDTLAEHKQAHSKYMHNPWDVPINKWIPCPKCGKIGVAGIAVYPHKNRTYVYKSIAHSLPGDKHKNCCYETLERFNGKYKYEELLRMKGHKK